MVNRHTDGTIEFAYFRPGAGSVRLTGDFGPGVLHHGRMQRDEHGWWRIRFALPAGEYRFRYLVDEQLWEADFAAFGVENDKEGGWKSVIWIENAPASAAAAAAA